MDINHLQNQRGKIKTVLFGILLTRYCISTTLNVYEESKKERYQQKTYDQKKYSTD